MVSSTLVGKNEAEVVEGSVDMMLSGMGFVRRFGLRPDDRTRAAMPKNNGWARCKHCHDKETCLGEINLQEELGLLEFKVKPRESRIDVPGDSGKGFVPRPAPVRSDRITFPKRAGSVKGIVGKDEWVDFGQWQADRFIRFSRASKLGMI